MEDTISIREWDGRLVGYGWGLMHFQYHGLRGLFHSGQWVGFRSATLQVPDRNLAIVVLGNIGASGNLREWQVLEIYAEDAIGAAETDRAGAEPPPSLEQLAVAVTPETLERYVGTYDFGTPDGSSEVLRVDREGDRLIIKFTTDREPSTWVPISPTEFKSQPDGPTLGFEIGDTGSASAAVWRARSYPRAEPFHPDVKELGAYTGTFYSDELDIGWRFEIEDGERLVATQMRWGETLTFTPTVTDEFRGNSLITRARFLRNAAGDIIGVSLSGRRALNNWFVKLDRVDQYPR